MKTSFTLNNQKLFVSIITVALLSISVYADCTRELFNIASAKGTTVGEFVDQISDECGISLIVTDTEAEKILKKQMNKTYIKNLTINEVLDLIVKENNLQYTLQKNILKISYLTTKTYQLDYIIAERKGEGSTNIRLSSNTGTSAGSSSGSQGSSMSSGTGSSSESGTNISSKDEVKFWADLLTEIQSVLSRPEDDYRQINPVAPSTSMDTNATFNDLHNIYINKAAGLVTVTGTGKQLKRLDSYIANLQKRMQSQVMIDVKLYSVVFQDGNTKGVDWAQLYALQNIDLGFNSYKTNNMTTFSGSAASGGSASNIISPISTVTGAPNSIMSIFQIGAKASIHEVVKFLETQGDVHTLSNPKILTLNNQPALITAGTELFYKTKSSATLAGGSTGTTSQSETVSSVFSGVLLDITPEIADDGLITLRINPSISDVASQLEADNSTRTMPPDLSRRQLSSVVTVKDGSRIILGGLITTKNDVTSRQVPLLGSIPFLGWLFKMESTTKKTEEIVIIIEPHIIKKDSNNVGLKELGYSHVQTAIEKEKIIRAIKATNNKEELLKMQQDVAQATKDLVKTEEKYKQP